MQPFFSPYLRHPGCCEESTAANISRKGTLLAALGTTKGRFKVWLKTHVLRAATLPVCSFLKTKNAPENVRRV
jgi:hypothetical protein